LYRALKALGFRYDTSDVSPVSPASYLKVCAMLVPREMKLEHSGGVKAMTDEQLERSIDLIKEMLAQREAGAKGLRSRCQPSRLHRVRQGARCEGATEPIVALRLGLWERRARTEILEQSTSAPRMLSADVADAIEALVGPPERRSLPVAFDKNVQKLVEIAHTDEDVVHEQTAIAARSMTETFLNRLSRTRRCRVLGTKRKSCGRPEHLPVLTQLDIGPDRNPAMQQSHGRGRLSKIQNN
jgi:hypothetical protein